MNHRISVITATFNAPAYLERAVHCLLAQHVPHWELIISPDDGHDYRHFEQLDARIKVVRPQCSHTGVGAARNRGLALATGEYVATLDDDDQVEPNFVGELLHALRSHDTVTLATKYVSETGQEIRAIGHDHATLDIPSFARQLGSMHAVGRRHRHPSWRAGFAQDVIHTCEAIDRAGGAIPVVQSTHYLCTVRAHSTCAKRRDIDDEYRRIIDSDSGAISAHCWQQTVDLFKYRRDINARFERRQAQALGYHEFVRELAGQAAVN
jgi:glycosyltransferase involved in cell wall biosynthesis